MLEATRRPWSLRARVLAGVLALGVVLAGIVAIQALPGSEPVTATLPTSEPLLVFAEFGATADRLYLASPEDPDQRTLVDTIEHADGWGIYPGTGVAGPLVAYTVFPPGVVPERDSPAELWVLDLATLERTRLARDADLTVAPVFADGGSALVYRRSAGTQQELVRVQLADATRTVIHAEQTSFGIMPIGYGADGGFLFARLSTEGTEVLSIRSGASPAFLFHASDHIARDWQISPDGESVSFLAPELLGERIVHRARVIGIPSSRERTLPGSPSATGEQYGPVWTPDGRAITVGQEAETVQSASAAILALAEDAPTATLPGPDRGFDVPVQWSPDGRYLAARTLDGVNSVSAGSESAVIIGIDGTRRTVATETEVILIGWYVHA